MTNEQLALALDPERLRAGWWEKHYACPHCGDTRDRPNYYVPYPAESGEWARYNCRMCHRNVLPALSVSTKLPDGYGWVIVLVPDRIPPLATDDLAAMQYVVPVLSKCRLLIEIYPNGCYVRDDETRDDPEQPWSSWVCISGGDTDDGAPIPLAPACAAAVAWLLANERERWDAAVREVGRG